MIKEFLKKNQKKYDQTIEQYFPKKITKSFLEKNFGPGDYDLGAINKCLTTPIWNYFEQGGKRLRPALFTLVLGCYKDPEPFIQYSIIAELIHNGSLVVDDIEDNSDTRRGHPCMHKKFGLDVAINAGNAMYLLPYFILDKASEHLKSEIYHLINKTLFMLHMGQATDIHWHNNPQPLQEEKYLQMCRMKTGMLTGFSCRMAGLVGEIKDLDALENFGRAIGIAFQIKDDILNIEGGDKWGKDFGDDINEGKMTLLVIHTLDTAPKKDTKRLTEILNLHTNDKKLINEAIDIIKKHGAIDYAKKKAEKIITQSWKDVEPILPECKNKKILKELVDFLVDREF
ncbi:MAG: polyprenyl synthetase family protein [Nanoarchaeota archaeon]|nr:polyprenyl synthetase family protein [Nanoarchaeota archaeon]MBU1975289.1 polyprenyl synthetase family protein [Nanoarchaeota archaeon]